MDDQTLITLTADIVAAHVSNNNVAVGDVPTVIARVHEALASLGAEVEAPVVEKQPAVSIRASVKPDYLVCLECGAKQKTLKRHLRVAHGMEAAQYRAEFKLPADYPMVAPEYSKARGEMARSIGLGRKKEVAPERTKRTRRKKPDADPT